MVKITVYLNEDVVCRLRVLARRHGCRQAEIIRDVLTHFVEAESRSAESQSMERPAPVGAGQFRSGRTDMGRGAGELLRQAARKGRLRISR